MACNYCLCQGINTLASSKYGLCLNVKSINKIRNTPEVWSMLHITIICVEPCQDGREHKLGHVGPRRSSCPGYKTSRVVVEGAVQPHTLTAVVTASRWMYSTCSLLYGILYFTCRVALCLWYRGKLFAFEFAQTRGAPICIFELGSTFKVVAVSELSHLTQSSSEHRIIHFDIDIRWVFWILVLPYWKCIVFNIQLKRCTVKQYSL